MQLTSGYLKARMVQTAGKNIPVLAPILDTQKIPQIIKELFVLYIYLHTVSYSLSISREFKHSFDILFTTSWLLPALNFIVFSGSIAYIEFKTEAEAEKMLEEAQGADVQGRAIMVDYVGEKSQKGAKVAGKHDLKNVNSKCCHNWKSVITQELL